MSQLWKLVLLCGLLAGASASLLDSIKSDLSNVVEEESTDLKSGLEGAIQTLKSDLNALQESPAWQLAKKAAQEAESLVESAVSNVLSVREKLLKMVVVESSLLDVQVSLSPDGQGLTLKIPITANVSATLPVIGQVVSLKVGLDLVTPVSFETDAQTNLPTTILGQCASDSVSISLSLLNNQSKLVNSIVDSVTGLLENTASFLLKNQLCPLIQTYISNLSVDSLQNIASQLQSVGV